MSDSSPLVVPIDVEALVVNDSVRNDAFQRWRYSYRALGLFNSAEPAPFGPVDTQFTAPGGTIVTGGVTVSEYYNGIYLKWRLPDALRRGTQDNATGTTSFPKVPNRWLVIRDGQAAWIVESDARRTPGTVTSYADTGADFLDPTGNPMVIGQAIPLTSAGWAEPGTPTFLTAVAPGNVGFSAYQPACQNVFSMVDQLAGSSEQAHEYLVVGWHSDPTDDPLHGVATAKDFQTALDAQGWVLPNGSDPEATASSVIYYGTVSGVGDPSAVTASGAPPKDQVSVAVAPSSARALSTLVGQQAGSDHAAIDAELLEALVLDLVRRYDQPDGPAAVQEAAFASGFKTFDGGSSWVLVPAKADGSAPPPPLTTDQLAALAKLNQAQADADSAQRTLADLQRRLYELWFKYELLPAPGTTLTQDDLRPQLDPTNPSGLAGQVVAAKADAAAKAATVATLCADGAAPAGYAFKQEKRTPFAEPVDPVVLLSKAGAPSIAGAGAKLECRLTDQLVSGYTTAGGDTVTPSSPGVAIPAPTTGTLTGVPWPTSLLTALLTDTYFLDRLPEGAAPTGIAPASGRTAWQEQPWRPLYLMWRGKYYAIAHDVNGAPTWTFADGEYTWNGQGAAPTASAVQLQGRILLTPQASLTVGARLQQLLDTTPDLDAAEREALKALQAYVESKDDWDLLSQALDGFTDQLLKRTTGTFPAPGLSDLQTTPSQAQLIDGGAGNPPRPANDGSFQPWRSGQFEFVNLAVVDEWGQAIFVASNSDFQQLILHRPDEMLPAPKSVLAPEPDPLVQLSPALLQPGRLNFDLVSATDDTQVLGLAPNVDPICGWVLPNHLDQALMAFDATGAAVGEIGLGIGSDQQPAVVWRAAPGSSYSSWAAVTAIPHLGPFLALLRSGSAADLTAILAAIDETLWTTAPVGTAFDRDLATLAGRPLALVRARLAFELEGAPIADPSWNATTTPAPTPAPTWSYPVQLGNLAKLSDGLIGYFSGDDYTTMYVVAQSGATAGDYLHLIGSGDGLIPLTFDGTTSAYVSMLVDPRASVHATTAVLPVSSVTIPPALVTDALERMDLSFRVGPMLTTQVPTKDGPALAIPQPAGQGPWRWIDAGAASSPPERVVGPGTRARFGGTPSSLRSGWLDLQSAFASADPSEKGSQP